jgi:hypothetical protein
MNDPFDVTNFDSILSSSGPVQMLSGESKEVLGLYQLIY